MSKSMLKSTYNKKELKHGWAFDEHNNIVNAHDVTEQDKARNKYYIVGLNEFGEEVRERVMHVAPSKRQPHYRCYPTKITKTSDGEVIKRVADTSLHGETMLHKMAKDIFKSGEIAWINLPVSVLKTKAQAILNKKKSIFMFQSCEIEKRFDIEELGTHVVFDILAYNKVKNTYLGIEIFVGHRSEASKIEKLRYINFDVIEVDLSDLNNPIDLADKNLRYRVMERIRDCENTIYLRECLVDNMRNALNNIAEIDELESTRLSGDGRFIFYKDKFASKLPNCYWIQTWDGNTEPGNINKRIGENQCVNCERYMGTYKRADGKEVMFCNQSNLPTRNLMNTLIGTLLLG